MSCRFLVAFCTAAASRGSLQIQFAGRGHWELASRSRLAVLTGITYPALVEPLEKVAADVAHALPILDKGRTATAATEGGESGLGAARDQRRFNIIDGSIKPSRVSFSKLVKGGEGGTQHECYSQTTLARMSRA
jgi:hypothetical protein